MKSCDARLRRRVAAARSSVPFFFKENDAQFPSVEALHPIGKASPDGAAQIGRLMAVFAYVVMWLLLPR